MTVKPLIPEGFFHLEAVISGFFRLLERRLWRKKLSNE
jgi:hypothetical protein